MRMPAYTPPITYDIYGMPIITDLSPPVRRVPRRKSVSCMRLVWKAVLGVIVLAVGLTWPLLFMSVCACLLVYYKWDVIKLMAVRLYSPKLARALKWTLVVLSLFYREASWHSQMRQCVLINVCGPSIHTITNMSHVHVSNDTHVELTNSIPLAMVPYADFSYIIDTTPREDDFKRVVYNLFDYTPVVSVLSSVANGTCVMATSLRDELANIATLPGRTIDASLERFERAADVAQQGIDVAQQGIKAGFDFLRLVCASVVGLFASVMGWRGLRYNGHSLLVY